MYHNNNIIDTVDGWYGLSTMYMYMVYVSFHRLSKPKQNFQNYFYHENAATCIQFKIYGLHET